MVPVPRRLTGHMDLFSPVQLGDLELANRIAMAPLTRMRSGADGVPGDIVVEHYAWRSEYATSTPAADDRHAGMVLLTAEQVEQGARADYVCLRIEGEAVPDR